MRISKKKAAFIILTALFFWVLWGNKALEVNEFVIRSEGVPAAFSGFRIAHVSDLHNAEFGDGNAKLLNRISAAAPDLIVISGDLVDSRNTDVAAAVNFAREAGKTAPVYYVTGNHEARIAQLPDLKRGLEDAGVTILDNEKLRLERAGEAITLMGMMDPSFMPGEDAAAAEKVLENLTDVSDGYTVLLSHRPELFDAYVNAGADLVFSGHAHGGQFRFPLVGGLVAPNQGLFPRYDSGRYTSGSTNMIVSRGLGNSIIPIRFNNRPELIVVTLEAAGPI